MTAGGSTASPRGDQRREALLTALDEQLRTQSLDSIAVADLTDAAGITRSAFYFYFESKAAAVTTLLATVEAEAADTAGIIVSGAGSFRDRVNSALDRLVDRALDNAHIYLALLTVRTTHESTRELWDAGRMQLAAPIADHIRAERLAGRAPDGADPELLAGSLVQVNEAVLERMIFDPGAPRGPLLATASDLWVRAVYGRPDPEIDPHIDSPGANS